MLLSRGRVPCVIIASWFACGMAVALPAPVDEVQVPSDVSQDWWSQVHRPPVSR